MSPGVFAQLPAMRLLRARLNEPGRPSLTCRVTDAHGGLSTSPQGPAAFPQHGDESLLT